MSNTQIAASCNSDAVAESLFDALTTADGHALAALAETLRDFKTHHARSYRILIAQPFTAKLVDSIFAAAACSLDVAALTK